ncbi:MAG: AAA family ATPase [Actinomycetes bacterium]
MRLHRLELSAFGPYAGTERVDFDALAEHGIFLLTGPTGAGKTSILDAICFALYGAVPGARQQAKRLRSDHADPSTRTGVVLELTIRGQRLRVSRTPEQTRPKQRGTGTTTAKATATLEQWADGGWQCLSSRPDEVGEHLGLLLGMSRDQFCQVVLLPQGDFATFLRSDAEHRRALLQRLFATERFEQVERQLREWRAAADAEATVARSELHETLARLAEAAGDVERPDGIDVAAWVDDVRDTAHKRLVTAAGEASAVRVTAQRARDRHKAAEELAVLQQQHTDAMRRKAALDARRADIELAKHELTAAQRAALVRPLVGTAASAASAQAYALASLTDARADLAAQPQPGPALAAATEAALATKTAVLREECGSLSAALTLEADAAAREREAQEREAAAAEAAERVQAHEVWLAGYDAERALRDEHLLLAREHATLVAPRREAVRSATDRLTAGIQRDDLVVRRIELQSHAALLVDRAQDAREHLFDLREQRINGIAGELAETLLPGEPCPVCGSGDHPTPAPAGPATVTSEEEIAAQDAWNTAEQERRAAEAALQKLDTLLAEARAGAGGDVPIDALQATLTDARAALAAAEEGAAAVSDLIESVTAIDAERAERDRDRALWLQRRQKATTEAVEARRFVTDATARLTDARGSDDSVAARAERLALLADLVDAVLQAERDVLDAAKTATSAQAAAETAAREAGFRNLDDAADAARDATRARELESMLAEFAAETAKVAEHLDNPALATAAAAPRVDVASALVELEEIETQLRTLDGAQGAAQIAVTAIDRLHAHVLDQVGRLAPKQQRCALLNSLCELVNGVGADNERRMTLSAYVLAARLEQVAAAATSRLLQMSGGRYSLVHTDERDSHGKRSGLGLAVIDGWTGAQRPTATLSGGESFFASLALALGLADVAAAESGGARLETLFVDEGFGSLDDDTLDEVMTVLDGLRDGGRVIGIVSHLADLRQRVPAQLAVRKTATGSALDGTGQQAIAANA